MNFCYVDESGDCGGYDPANPNKTGSRFFILAGLIVPTKNWKPALDFLKSFRKKIAAESYLPYDVEFHCAELIDPHKIKVYTSISISDRWKLIERYADTIGQFGPFKIISVVLDKSNSQLSPDSYLTESLTKLYQIYDVYLKSKTENGLLFFDRANEKHVSTHVRKLTGTGSSGSTIPGIRIGWVIEDPIFRNSAESIFVQSADVIAYTLKEKEFPTGSRKKFQADKIFDSNLNLKIFKSSHSDEDGIARL